MSLITLNACVHIVFLRSLVLIFLTTTSAFCLYHSLHNENIELHCILQRIIIIKKLLGSFFFLIQVI